MSADNQVVAGVVTGSSEPWRRGGVLPDSRAGQGDVGESMKYSVGLVRSDKDERGASVSDELMAQLKDSLIGGDSDVATECTNKLLEAGTSSKEILDAMIAAMSVVGERFEKQEFYLPDLILAGTAMRAGLDLILPGLKSSGQSFRGRIILGSVKGDVHDVGKSIVASTLAGAGYEVIDIGVDVAPEVFAQKAMECEADVVGASAYMTTTTAVLPEVNEALKAAGIRDKVKFVIGGAATSDAYVAWSGADGWGETAWDAVNVINGLLGK